MSYQLGVDVGTTFSAAAVHRDGRAAIATLGGRAPSIPSVVLLREDGTYLTGDAAERRAASEPERVVREFKRRLGDSTPIIVGGAPHSAESLTAKLLGAIVDKVAEGEGGRPDKVVVTRPANWGEFKIDLLSQAARLAGIDPDVLDFITEPEAAAISYAAQERVAQGEIIAVYDLGGGTFDAAVLERTTASFKIIGRPEGIERLGGIDFSAAVFAHVGNSLGDALTELDPADPAALAAVARLRRDCVEAKEALSSDTDAVIPVLLPSLQTEVRITRAEFEGLIRPSLLDTVGAMERAIASADLAMEDVTRILLVGGSSRIPLVAQMVSSQLARPVAVDTHPKHTVAVGAAFAAGGILEEIDAIEQTGQIPAKMIPGPDLDPAKLDGDSAAAGSAGVDDDEAGMGFVAGQTRISDRPLPGPQLVQTPDSVVNTPAAKAEPVTPPDVGRPGGPGGPGSQRPQKARPVTSPGIAPPPMTPPNRAGAAAGLGGQRPQKAERVQFPGEPPPKAQPVVGPGQPPPQVAPPGVARPGGVGQAPNPLHGVGPLHGSAGPLRGAVGGAQSHGRPPGPVQGADTGGSGGNSALLWVAVLAVIIAVLVLVAVLAN
ncbi:MAG: Hsp70 family protein [Actinomycetota bacterium]